MTPFVRTLLVTLVASFVATAVLQNFVGVPVVQVLALHPGALSVATLWQLFTHVLVMSPDAGSIFFVLLSLVFLWWCLAPIEERYGRARAVQLSVAAALCAGVPALLVGLALPGFAGLVGGPSSITLAAISAYVALIPPHAEMSLGRVSFQARHILWFNIALSVMGFLTTKNAAQLAADLGAIGAGIGFVKWWVMRVPRTGRASSRSKGAAGRLRLVKSDDEDDGPKRWLN